MREFLLLDFGFVILVVVLFFLGRRNKGPTRLNLSNGPRRAERIGPSRALTETNAERSLHVFYNYNGETFEAYEVLGLPAGTSVDMVRAHFAAQFAHRDPTDRILYEMALKAIEKGSG